MSIPLRRPKPFRQLLALAACLLVTGCAGRDFNTASPEPMRADLLISIERAENVPPGSLYLKPIPGRLLGASADEELFRSTAGAGQVQVPVRTLATGAAAHARMAHSNASNPGELASPRGLGIARIGTFYSPAVRNTGCNNFSAGLRIDQPAKALLVYVDRPGTVRGVRYSRPYIMDYRLEFPEAGIYAIALQTQGVVVTQRVVDVPTPFKLTVRRAPCA